VRVDSALLSLPFVCADGCEAGKPFTAPSTWTDILNREQARVLRLLLALRPDGHQFHQVIIGLRRESSF
jgi:hypothetical protein